jgi:hypothetical protein
MRTARVKQPVDGVRRAPGGVSYPSTCRESRGPARRVGTRSHCVGAPGGDPIGRSCSALPERTRGVRRRHTAGCRRTSQSSDASSGNVIAPEHTPDCDAEKVARDRKSATCFFLRGLDQFFGCAVEKMGIAFRGRLTRRSARTTKDTKGTKATLNLPKTRRPRESRVDRVSPGTKPPDAVFVFFACRFATFAIKSSAFHDSVTQLKALACFFGRVQEA